MGNGLQDAIDELLAERDRSGLGGLRRIILETSGLAEPAPIVRALTQTRQMEFRLRIISTLDCLNAPVADELAPQYAAQLAAAQSIALTKLDVVDDSRRREAEMVAASVNPFASLVTSQSADERCRLVFEDGEAASLPSSGLLFSAHRTGNEQVSIVLATWTGPVTWADVSEWLENVSGYCGERLLRAKGFVRVAGCDDMVLLNGVGTVFSPPRRIKMDAQTAEGLVLILRDIDVAELREFSNASSENPPSLRSR
ncbi:GTP-binding protein [Sinorhizobium fredii]|uniref:GTP-binding protein n=1 Tax=Rhizobium fredii TaxID=380 RepID=UPI003399A92A